MKTTNHPKKGSRITVDPIRDEKDIQRIKKMLKSNLRDLLLFTMGINNGLRMGDLLSVRVGQVKDLKVGECLTIREQKTRKDNVLMINKGVYSVLQDYLSDGQFSDDDYLFQSRKGNNNPLTVSSVHRMVKEWTFGMDGNYGTHSLRKSFGFFQRTKYGVGLEVLCKRFNHSSPSTTLRYIGLTDKDVNDILMNEI